MNAVIATTPAGMLAAQEQMLEWVKKKWDAAALEVREHEDTINALRAAGMRFAIQQKHLAVARSKIRHYERIRAALQAGYYIIPPFDAQVFAIRTDKDAPPREIEARHWVRNEEKYIARLPPGEGNYAGPVERVHMRTETAKNADGSTREVKIYENDDWDFEIDLPVRAHKPTIIAAVAKAMGERIFDALAIAPQYRAADPLIVGQIKHWKNGVAPLTFFVAWWMDWADL